MAYRSDLLNLNAPLSTCSQISNYSVAVIYIGADPL
jgi:hypothetical protein